MCFAEKECLGLWWTVWADCSPTVTGTLLLDVFSIVNKRAVDDHSSVAFSNPVAVEEDGE